MVRGDKYQMFSQRTRSRRLIMGAPVMDVIVIGCGASGLAALRKLHCAGLKVIGLEAGDRVGGRIRTIQYGNGHLDLGAAWCHGEKDNIVFEIANPLGLLGRPEPDNKWFLMSTGELVSNDLSEEILQALDGEIGDAEKNNTMSISECVRSAARSNTILKSNPGLARCFINFYENNSHLGGETDPCQGKSLKGLEESWPCEGEFMLNWKGRGYEMILDVLLNKYPDASKELQIPIHLKKKVENIKWRSSPSGLDASNPLVHVRCADGSLYAAKSIVVTVSLGVLKERHNDLFNPPLPAEKINAIKNLQMAVVDKIYIEFSEPWWPKTPANFTFLWRDEDRTKFTHPPWVTQITGMYTVEYHPNLLLAWINGDSAVAMEKADEGEVKAAINKVLDLFFKKQFKVTPVKSILRSQWGTSALTRGTYSYRSVANEQNGGGATVLSEPLYHANHFPVVCFAGEATSHHRHPAVHGAIEAGFREADRLITNFKL